MKNTITAKVGIVIKAPVSKVWEALTKPEIVKRYFFDTNMVTEWKVGGPIQFHGEHEGKTYSDKGTVLVYEPQNKIQYTYWSSMSGKEDKPENYATVTYSLRGEGDTTTLGITQENVPDEKTKEHAEENWKKLLVKLKTLLEDSQGVAAF